MKIFLLVLIFGHGGGGAETAAFGPFANRDACERSRTLLLKTMTGNPTVEELYTACVGRSELKKRVLDAR